MTPVLLPSGTRIYKTIIILILLVSLSSAVQYVFDQIEDSIRTAEKSYLAKQDYVEGKYNRYLVYRYYSWLNDLLKGKEYGLLVARTDSRSYARYLHRLNYFLYPKHVLADSDILFAPRLDTLKSTVILKGKVYSLRYRKENTGVFIAK